MQKKRKYIFWYPYKRDNNSPNSSIWLPEYFHLQGYTSIAQYKTDYTYFTDIAYD